MRGGDVGRVKVKTQTSQGSADRLLPLGGRQAHLVYSGIELKKRRLEGYCSDSHVD